MKSPRLFAILFSHFGGTSIRLWRARIQPTVDEVVTFFGLPYKPEHGDVVDIIPYPDSVNKLI